MSKYKDVDELFDREKKLGEGVYGQVWKVKSIFDDKIYALKLIDKSMEKRKLEYIKDEIEISKAISSEPHCKKYLACIVDSFEFKNYIGILMEYIKGQTIFKLFELLQSIDVPIKDEELFKFMKHILSGLDELHSEGIAHRDIKDENILFNDHELKIVDFGFACYYKGFHKNLCEGILGSPAFIAPEVWAQKELLKDPLLWGKCDIWSAGLVFYELASLQDPPDLQELQPYMEIDDKKLKRKLYKIIDKTVKETNKDLVEIIKLCLEPDPKKRPSAKELLEMLKHIKV